MADYKTPGVYVEEISKFPPSVAGVATAIPAFIGFTAKCPNGEQGKPVKVTSMVDYETKFGGAPVLQLDGDDLKNNEFVMYDSMRLFFDNGGGTCYVSSIGQYYNEENVFCTENLEKTSDNYKSAITPLERVDEVTLVLFPDAALVLNSESELGSVHQDALNHCGKMGDRFAILDVKDINDPNDKLGVTLKAFRGNVGANNLSYGAAYYPYLKTTYTKEIGFDEMLKIAEIKKEANNEFKFQEIYDKILNDEFKKLYTIDDDGNLKKGAEIITESDIDIEAKLLTGIKAEKEKDGEKDFCTILDKTLQTTYTITDEDGKFKKGDTVITKSNIEIENNILKAIKSTKDLIEKSIKNHSPLYSSKLAEFQSKAQIITPSAAIAGIYASVDANKGVWQAPANVSVSSVSTVSEMISDYEQEDMNVDANAGKSINAIRYFSGKGIIVWGSRTLDGNSNEWRYVPVRRLFNYIEESVQKSTNWAVFQPNDANTWIKVRCQIENFLSNLWRDGALAGSTPDKAFYVRVGLDETMTAQDILEGKMIVEIGLAAVRPAEFIILKFSHKLQEA